MKKTILLAIVAFLTIPALLSAAKKTAGDPVVMKIGGCDVKMSEFEYLYKKNNAQLESDMTIDSYIDMFVNYKLKVCAAKDAGIDTTEAYLRDMKMYAAELSEPYMTDREMLDSLVAAAYSHRTEVVLIHHLLLPHKTPDEKGQQAIADSLRGLVAAGADFEEIIRKHSIDPSAPKLAGRMRVTGGYLPYEFEDMAYRTPVGQLSPVFATQFGLHLIRVDERHPNPGEIKARHILKMTRNLPEDRHGEVLAKIDSIRALIAGGADFGTVAKAETEDPSGRANGGELPWFGPGRMVPEFEDAAYSLADGELSQPVKTDFGYHLILREGIRPIAPVDSVRDEIEAFIARDYRSGLLGRRAIDRYAESTGSRINQGAMKKVNGLLKKCGGLNAASRREIASMKDAAFTVDGQKYNASAVVEKLGDKDVEDINSAIKAYGSALESVFVETTGARMRATLADREPAYRNLMNEYSDGMLLYEISNRLVWDRANNDQDGLEAYFRSHRDAYRWDSPHYKGYVVSAESDSIAAAAVEYLGSLQVEDSAYVTELRKKFGTKAKIERVITARGASPIIDHIAFGAPAPQPGKRWNAYRAFRGEIAEQPSTAMDVKGLVSMDYQQELEEQWLRQLHEKYSIEVDRDLIKSSI